MRALIICDNHGPFPAALLERRPLCLMPVGTKPVLLHAVESLARMGIKRISLAVCEHAAYVQGVFGTGLRWGVELEYVLTREFSGIAEAVRLAAPGRDERLLVVPALAVTDASPSLLSLAEAGGEGPAILSWEPDGEGHRPEYLFIGGGQARALAAGAASAREAAGGGAKVIPAPGAAVLVRDLPSYWEANRKLLSGEPPFEAPSPRPGPRSRVHPGARLGEGVLLDEAVEIGAACQVGPLAAIGAHCILDDGAEARECVILSGTFVGRNTSVVRAIADQGLLVGLDDGSELHVPDPFILGPASAASFSGLAWELLQRAVALAVLAASAPVLAVLALRGLWSDGFWIRREVVVSREISSLSGEKSFAMTSILNARTRTPFLAGLPALWDVFRGRLALAGVEPLTPEEAAALAGGWAEPRFSCRAGLVNPWHAEGGGAEDIERRVMEVYYAQTRSAAGDVKLLRRAARRFFSEMRRRQDR